MRALSSSAERVLLFAAVTIFWAAVYFAVGAWNASRPMQVLPWDPVWRFPFVSAFVLAYDSAYLLPFFAFLALKDRAGARRFAAVVAGVIAVSAACFLAWPLLLPRPPIATASAFDRLLAALYAADRPTNLFPSLHVSLSFLFALAAGRAWPKRRLWFLAWAVLIAASTLFTRQHYFVDVIGGALAAFAAWRIFLGKRK
ncbi:MAG TPA: phosphatase PAP2 family protein [Candidatus Baltobacteraceae bacterium]|nr:phosphatase PAP2 family protein [Candidatus Baltobacteraceae bacterium]